MPHNNLKKKTLSVARCLKTVINKFLLRIFGWKRVIDVTIIGLLEVPASTPVELFCSSGTCGFHDHVTGPINPLDGVLMCPLYLRYSPVHDIISRYTLLQVTAQLCGVVCCTTFNVMIEHINRTSIG